MKRAGVIVMAILLGGSLASASAAVKLPKKLTSPTGNFFTLYAFDQPTKTDPVASALMQVCTSKHTPPDTIIEPALFTVKLSNGKTVSRANATAHSPQLTPEPLKPLQCSTKGWISFDVPKGATVSELLYDYNGQISWNVG